MEYQTHQQFYDIHGDEAVSSRLSPVTHEELYQHIKARLFDDVKAEILGAIDSGDDSVSSDNIPLSDDSSSA